MHRHLSPNSIMNTNLVILLQFSLTKFLMQYMISHDRVSEVNPHTLAYLPCNCSERTVQHTTQHMQLYHAVIRWQLMLSQRAVLICVGESTIVGHALMWPWLQSLQHCTPVSYFTNTAHHDTILHACITLHTYSVYLRRYAMQSNCVYIPALTNTSLLHCRLSN